MRFKIFGDDEGKIVVVLFGGVFTVNYTVEDDGVYRFVVLRDVRVNGRRVERLTGDVFVRLSSFFYVLSRLLRGGRYSMFRDIGFIKYECGECAVCAVVLALQRRIVFFGEEVERLYEDACRSKPKFVVVPPVWETMTFGSSARVEEGFWGITFRWPRPSYPLTRGWAASVLKYARVSDGWCAELDVVYLRRDALWLLYAVAFALEHLSFILGGRIRLYSMYLTELNFSGRWARHKRIRGESASTLLEMLGGFIDVSERIEVVE